jgi:hypothetical protein
MKDLEKVAAKGGIALHYDMKDLCTHRLSTDPNDERPISPAKHEQMQKHSLDRRDRKARESMGDKKKKLDSAMVRRPAKEVTKSMYVDRVEKRSNSSHMVKKKQMSRAHVRNDEKTNGKHYQLATSPDKNKSPRLELSPKKPYLKRKKNEMSKTL